MNYTQEQRETWLRNACNYGGGFLQAFVRAYRRADLQNQHVLDGALECFMDKYQEYLVDH